MIIKLPLTRLLLLVCLPWMIATPVLAQEDFLPPDQAFPLQARAKDANTVIAEWKITEGYYLYHNKFQFRSDTPGIELGKPVIPAGKIKHDEYFGDVETHRGTLQIEIPVKRAAGAPATLELVTKSQGCADAGLCYPPYEQRASITLAAAGTATGTVTSAAAPAPAQAKTADPLEKLQQLGTSLGLQEEQEFLPPDQAFILSTSAQGQTLQAQWRIADGYYLYRDKFTFKLKNAPAGVSLGEATLPPGEEKQDEYFGLMRVFHHGVAASVPIQGAQPNQALQLEIGYQGCADAGLCYPPIRKTIAFNLGQGATQEATAAAVQPAPAGEPVFTPMQAPSEADLADLSESERLERLFKHGNLWTVLSTLLGFGLLLAFTACMYPMIPIVSSLIVGQGEKINAVKGFLLSLTYVLAMAVTFGVIGAIFGFLGEATNIAAQFQKPWVIVGFVLLFLALALAMFGFYNIQMPSAIQSRLNELSNRQRGGSLIGVAVMGVLSALIIGPCGGPILLATIAGAAASDSMALGFAYMFTLAIGMGLPLLLVGAGGGKLLPRAGAWMNVVKAVGGVILVAISIYLLERILPAPVYMLMWATLFMVSGVYMGAFESLPKGTSGWYRLWKGFGLVLLLYGVLVMLGGLTGARNFNDPLHGSRLLGGSAPAVLQHGAAGRPAYVEFAQGKPFVVKGGLTFIKIRTAADFDRELKSANAAGKTVMLDFYADWCTYCKQFDDYVFSEPKVQSALSNTVLIQADITEQNEADKELLKHVDVITAPAILFYRTDGQEVRKQRVLGFMSADKFLQRVNQSFQ